MTPELISLLSIILAVAVFIFLVYRGTVVIVAATVAAIIISVFSGGNIMGDLKEVYMPGMVGFAKGYFLLFCLSALFGRLVADSGAAYSIAAKVTRVANRIQKPQLKIFGIAMVMPIVGMILTAAGISMYVIAFTLVAIASLSSRPTTCRGISIPSSPSARGPLPSVSSRACPPRSI